MKRQSSFSRIGLSLLAVWLGSFWLLPIIPVEWENRIFSAAGPIGTVYLFGILGIYFLFLYKMSVHAVASQDLSPRLRLMCIVANLTGFGAVVYFFARYIRIGNPEERQIRSVD